LAKLLLGNTLRKGVDRSVALRNLMWSIEAGMLASLWKVSSWLPPDRASSAGRRLMRVVGPRNDKTRKFKENLLVAFPELDEAGLTALIREAWGNLGSVMAEYPHLATICHGEADQRLQTIIKGDIEALKGGRPAIFVGAHLSNWEVSAAAIARLGVRLTVLYTPMHNPKVDRLLLSKRQALGCGLLGRDEATREMLRLLHQGQSLGLLVDQRVDSGEPVPFFGRDKMTTLIPARLALRFGCDLVPVQVERLAGARFRVTVHEPVEPAQGLTDDRAKQLDMMGKVNGLFERWIRARPQDWVCTKRRWPKGVAEAQAA
jgi:KDO2-lipid IV(A) lauroyltransferase